MVIDWRQVPRRLAVGVVILVMLGWTTAAGATTWVLDQLQVTKGGNTYNLSKNSQGQWVIPKWPDVPAGNSLAYAFTWRVNSGGYPGDGQVKCCSQVKFAGQDLGYGGVQTVSGGKVKKIHLFNYNTIAFPTTIEFRVTPDQAFSVTQLVLGNPPTLINKLKLTAFGLLMSPTFGHARCTNCHGMAASNQMFKTHQQKYNIPNTSAVQDSNNCKGCHQPQASNWRAPSSSFNWTGMTAKQACNLVKQKMSGSTLVNHLKNDPLIQWAISSAQVPPPGASRPKAPPGNLSQWNQRVDQWTSYGQPCPQ